MSAVRRTQHTQRAAVLRAPGQLQTLDCAIPSPAAGEVRVRMQGCGVCASSLPVWEGRPWFTYPLEAGMPGHEGWGRVDAVGEGVVDLEIGDRVALVSQHAFADFDVAPRAALVKLPSGLDGAPFPGEPLGCAMNIFERSGIRPGARVAIIGAGFLGTLLIQLAARTGAEVVALSRREYSLRAARQAGASHALECSDVTSARRQALAITGGRGFERVIETGGVQSTLDLAGDLAGERARLVIAGYHQDGLRQVNMQQWNWRGLDVVNAHERAIERYASGIAAAVHAVLDGLIDPLPLMTHCVPLNGLARALELTRTRPAGFVKAIVTMGERE